MTFPTTPPTFNPPPKIVQKGWGYEVWLHNDEKYCLKLLCFRPITTCSMHFHALKTETWYILAGAFELELLDTLAGTVKHSRLEAGDWLDIPPLMPHRLSCVSQVEGVIVEASTQHFENDSYRIAPGDSQK